MHFDLTLVIEDEHYRQKTYIRGSYWHIYYHQSEQNFNNIIKKCYTFRSLIITYSFCIIYSLCYAYVFLLLCMFRSRYCVSLCCSVHCLCVNVYCTTATGCQPSGS